MLALVGTTFVVFGSISMLEAPSLFRERGIEQFVCFGVLGWGLHQGVSFRAARTALQVSAREVNSKCIAVCCTIGTQWSSADHTEHCSPSFCHVRAAVGFRRVRTGVPRAADHEGKCLP
jgi:hypothetical protein